MTDPMVSVVMPVFNASLYVENSIISVLNQTYLNLELIIVDDGSIDNSNIILKKLQTENSRIKLLTQNNQGQSVARNRAINESQGQLIAFIDADDIWDPNKLERQIPLFRDPEIGLVYSGVQDIDADDRPIRGPEPWDFYRGPILEPLLRSNFVCTSSVVIRKHLLDKHGLRFMVGRQCEDWLLWCLVSMHAYANYVEDALVSYRVHSQGVSKQTRLMQEGEMACRIDMIEALKHREGSLKLDHERLLRVAELGMHTACYSFARRSLQEGNLEAARKMWKESVRYVPLRFGKVWRVATFPMRILASRLACRTPTSLR